MAALREVSKKYFYTQTLHIRCVRRDYWEELNMMFGDQTLMTPHNRVQLYLCLKKNEIKFE